MKGYRLLIGAEVEAIRQTFAGSSEFALVRAIQVHAEDLANLVPHDLHQHAFVVEQKLRGVKNGQSIPRSNFLERSRIEIVNPQVRWGLGVVLIERPAGTIASRFHAQKENSPTVREEVRWLPRNLIGRIQAEVTQPAAVGVYQCGTALRDKENPVRPRVAPPRTADQSMTTEAAEREPERGGSKKSSTSKHVRQMRPGAYLKEVVSASDSVGQCVSPVPASLVRRVEANDKKHSTKQMIALHKDRRDALSDNDANGLALTRSVRRSSFARCEMSRQRSSFFWVGSRLWSWR